MTYAKLTTAQRAALYRVERYPEGVRIHHASAMSLLRRGLVEPATPATWKLTQEGRLLIETMNDPALTHQQINALYP